MDLQKRKSQRLKDYDYSQNGAYFITLCTHNRISLFGLIDNGKLLLNNAGEMVFKKIFEMPEFYPDINIDKFIVMPNHLHVILLIQHGETAQGASAARGLFPTMVLSDYIQRFKTLTTKLYIDGVKTGDYPPFDNKVWQKSYYDHVIRNQQEYEQIWEYIDTNPLKWQEDKYFV